MQQFILQQQVGVLRCDAARSGCSKSWVQPGLFVRLLLAVALLSALRISSARLQSVSACLLHAKTSWPAVTRHARCVVRRHAAQAKAQLKQIQPQQLLHPSCPALPRRPRRSYSRRFRGSLRSAGASASAIRVRAVAFAAAGVLLLLGHCRRRRRCRHCCCRSDTAGCGGGRDCCGCSGGCRLRGCDNRHACSSQLQATT